MPRASGKAAGAPIHPGRSLVFLLDWLRTAVSWILVQFHAVFGAIFGSASGWAWGLSIVGLVIVIRILLIPLFVKQIKAQRNMQLIQPHIKEIQKKYAGDKQRQSEEMMKLYRESGTNPLASCLPILLQMPIFFALFSVLQGIATQTPEGVFKWPQYANLMAEARSASIFGAPLYGTFLGAAEVEADGFSPVATRIVTFILIILMTGTTFLTQRQLIVKNMAADNPIVRQQKVLLYVFPLMFAIGGINFPIGVLIYWFTTNLWSMGQQFYVIRNNPQPNTPAYESYLRRQAEKEARKAVKRGEVATVEEALKPKPVEPPKRAQPKRQSRSQRKRGGASSSQSPGNP
jgi:YidC/Oxa1 family membrane protein insertase